MNEADWFTSIDAHSMLRVIQDRASERKLRLFACACCRGIWEKLRTSEREAVRVAERYVDGQVKASTMRNAAPKTHSGVSIGASFYPGTAKPAWTMFAQVTAAHSPAYFPVGSEERSRFERRQIDLLHDIFSNPFQPVSAEPSWLTSTAVAIARQMYESRDFSAMPILADALQDARCSNNDILTHCRSDGPHVRGCWVVDLVLGKE